MVTWRPQTPTLGWFRVALGGATSGSFQIFLIISTTMPLPDERPRQSVANLIGRFEKQKSASAAPPIIFPPGFQRTSSVASHHTGDSAIEEIKEKREWPPKRVDAPSTAVSPPTPNPEKEPTVEPSSIPSPSDKEPPSPKYPPAPEPPAEAAPIPIPTDLSPPVPSPTKASASTPTKTAAPRTPISTKFSTLRPSTKSTSSTPQKPAAGASASATPLKPQHTGQSASSTRTPAPKASTVTKSSAATPPARAKTPVRTKTPIIRVKSPPSTVRPKTPSSGLYAPTAASLARSKNAPTRLVEEKPKRRITTDLSKPTAASASKVRTSVATPPKVTKPSMAKPGPPRSAISIAKTAAKPVSKVAVGKAGTTATRVKNEGLAVATPAGATMVPEDSHDKIDIATLGDTTSSHEVTEEVAEEHVSDTENNQVESYDNDSPEDGDIGQGEPVVETPDDHDTPGHDSAATDEAHDTHTELLEENAPEDPHTNGVAEPEFNTAENILVTPSHLDNDMEEDTIHAKIIPRPVGTDLEDIVNMLESVPIVHRPDLETTAPHAASDTEEIPDEY